MPRSIVLVLSILLLGADGASGDLGNLDLDQALQRAQVENLPVVVDFFTEWCGPCKVFDRDRTAADSPLSKALEDVIFVAVDAEKGGGVELAERFRVSGYPTFAVLDPTGELVARWMGYGGPEHFLGQLQSALGEMITVDERRQRHAARPNPDDAQKLAAVAQGKGEYREAIALYRQAEELDPELDHSSDLVFAGYLAAQNDDSFHAEDYAELLEEEVDERSPAFVWMGGYRMLCRVAADRDEPGLRRRFVERALAHASSSDAFSQSSREEFEILALLHVQGDAAEAIRRKRASLGEGWMEDPDRLVTYTWWCYENRVEVERAGELAEHGAELAEDGAKRAQLLYIASRIQEALGDESEALDLARRAVEADTGNAHYRELVEELEQQEHRAEG